MPRIKELPALRAARVAQWKAKHAADMKERARAARRARRKEREPTRGTSEDPGDRLALWTRTRRAVLGRRFPPLTCSRCGEREVPARFGDPSVAERLAGAGLCWSCAFWRDIAAAMAADPLSFVIDAGRAWQLGAPAVRGQVSIRWADGATAWRAAFAVDVGPVPPAWRAELADTGTLERWAPTLTRAD